MGIFVEGNMTFKTGGTRATAARLPGRFLLLYALCAGDVA